MSWWYDNPRVDYFTIGWGKYQFSRDNPPTECHKCGCKIGIGEDAFGDHLHGFVYCSEECFPKNKDETIEELKSKVETLLKKVREMESKIKELEESDSTSYSE